MKKNFHRLTLITNKGNAPTEPYIQFVQRCINAGVTCIQIREKALPYEELVSFASSLKNIASKNNIPLIINDNLDLCVRLDASGVHLGQSDGDPAKARALLGSNKIIGLSVNTIQQVQNSNHQPIDYIGIGAIFPSCNKPDIETIWGLDAFNQASLIASHPVVAIGGIDENNAVSVMNSGANGIAAIGAFHDAKDPFITTQNLIKMINEANNDG